jgi:hypothetical protein
MVVIEDPATCLFLNSADGLIDFCINLLYTYDQLDFFVNLATLTSRVKLSASSNSNVSIEHKEFH